ncbi:hypothetical protein EVAR_50984_1 [Eumeta japonica]|uniref:Uncharacterized protein n=1 Tax=Eumeta variegata TaxID=151549 RepID=A0A4C1XBZ6_EUMVA|nr:hypothetical protein EVAR_50984_1 [Eumeta japonica]
MSVRNKRMMSTMYIRLIMIYASPVFAHALPDILYYLQIVQNNFIEEQLTHHVSAVSYESPAPHHFCRRPRNVLIDSSDNLNVEVEKLIEPEVAVLINDVHDDVEYSGQDECPKQNPNEHNFAFITETAPQESNFQSLDNNNLSDEIFILLGDPFKEELRQGKILIVILQLDYKSLARWIKKPSQR